MPADVADSKVQRDRIRRGRFAVNAYAFLVTAAGKPAARGSITVVCLDQKSGRPHALSATLAEALRRHVAVG
jgi:acyl-CoA thioesterase FadM